MKFYQLPNSNLFTHRLLFFSREATSETYGSRVSFSYYFPLRSTFPLILVSDLLNQNTKIPCCTLFYLVFDLSIFTTLSCPFANFSRRYPKGIDNPFNTSGCECLLFVCKCCLRSGAWFSYWFDNLGLITKANTNHCRATSSLPLWENTDVVLADISRHHDDGPGGVPVPLGERGREPPSFFFFLDLPPRWQKGFPLLPLEHCVGFPLKRKG